MSRRNRRHPKQYQDNIVSRVIHAFIDLSRGRFKAAWYSAAHGTEWIE